MSAVLIDEDTQETQEATTVPPDTEALAPKELVESLQGQPSTQESQEDTDIPEKYRGKGLKDIINMHQEAEKVIGRHSSEVGELRQFVDGYIKGKVTDNLAKQAPTETTQEDPVDFFDDPEQAVRRAIDNHPSVRAAALSAQHYQQQAAVSAMKERHPDMPQVLGSPGFAEWVKGSKIRMELYERADKAYDVDAADELVTTYKERMNVVKQTQTNEQTARSQQIKAASTGSTSGAASGAIGSDKRIYRRTDLIKLMKTDPQRYETLSDEIMRAYQEGRVR